MKTFTLTISPDYVQDWTEQDAIREFVQNAIDQESADSSNVAYIKAATGCIIIENNNSILNHSTLLLGGGTKSNDNTAIGGFGEGYKIALLVLIRLGFKVYIANYGLGELWEPEISHSHEFGTNVLKIICKQLKHGTDITRGVSVIITKQEFDFNEVLHNVSLRHQVHSIIAESQQYGQILDPSVTGKGKIFIGGLYISTSDELEYSYNFKPGTLKIGRDRNITDTFNIKYYAGSYMFCNLISKHIDQFMEHLHNKIPDLEYVDKYSLPREAKQIIIEQYKDSSVISCEADKQILKDNGITSKSTVVVPKVIKELIWAQGSPGKSNTPIKRKSIKDLLVEFIVRHKDTLTTEQYDELQELAERK